MLYSVRSLTRCQIRGKTTEIAGGKTLQNSVPAQVDKHKNQGLAQLAGPKPLGSGDDHAAAPRD